MQNFITIRKLLFLFFLIVGIFGFFPDSSLPLRISQQAFCETVILLGIIIGFIRNKFLGMFICWCLISMVITGNKPAYITFNTVFIYVIFYQYFSNRFKEENLSFILNAICLACFFQIGLMTLQYFDIWFLIKLKDEILKNDPYQYVGLLGNANIAGSFICLCFPAFLRKKWVLGTPLVFWGLFLSKSMGGIVTAVLILAIFIFIKLRKKAIGYIVLIGLSCLFIFYCITFEDFDKKSYGNIYQLGTRTQHWAIIIKRIIPKKPYIGAGIGQFKFLMPGVQKYTDVYKDQYPYKPPGEWKQAHNEYLQVAVELGLIGLFLVLLYLISIVFKCFKYRKEIPISVFLGILAVLINSVVHFAFHTTSILIGILYFSIIDSKCWGKHYG